MDFNNNQWWSNDQNQSWLNQENQNNYPSYDNQYEFQGDQPWNTYQCYAPQYENFNNNQRWSDDQNQPWLNQENQSNYPSCDNQYEFQGDHQWNAPQYESESSMGCNLCGGNHLNFECQYNSLYEILEKYINENYKKLEAQNEQIANISRNMQIDSDQIASSLNLNSLENFPTETDSNMSEQCKVISLSNVEEEINDQVEPIDKQNKEENTEPKFFKPCKIPSLMDSICGVVYIEESIEEKDIYPKKTQSTALVHIATKEDIDLCVQAAPLIIPTPHKSYQYKDPFEKWLDERFDSPLLIEQTPTLESKSPLLYTKILKWLRTRKRSWKTFGDYEPHCNILNKSRLKLFPWRLKKRLLNFFNLLEVDPYKVIRMIYFLYYPP